MTFSSYNHDRSQDQLLQMFCLFRVFNVLFRVIVWILLCEIKKKKEMKKKKMVSKSTYDTFNMSLQLHITQIENSVWPTFDKPVSEISSRPYM